MKTQEQLDIDEAREFSYDLTNDVSAFDSKLSYSIQSYLAGLRAERNRKSEAVSKSLEEWALVNMTNMWKMSGNVMTDAESIHSLMRRCFNAGHESRQVEIDSLKKTHSDVCSVMDARNLRIKELHDEINDLKNSNNCLNNLANERLVYIKELQQEISKGRCR